MSQVKENKTIKSMKEFKKRYFPESYHKEQEEKEIERLGFGKWLARRFLNGIKRELGKSKEGER